MVVEERDRKGEQAGIEPAALWYSLNAQGC